MRVKRDKGFRKMKIGESNYENSKYSYILNNKCMIFLIIIGIFLIIFIFIEIFYLFHEKDDSIPFNNSNNQEVKPNKTEKNKIENNKTEEKDDNNQNNQNNNDSNDSENSDEQKQSDTESNSEYKNIYKKKFEKFNNPKISIIIIINKDNNDIEKLIYSIHKQTISDIEIIIVNDFLEEKNIIKVYNKVKKNDKRIKILEFKNNIGKLEKRIEGIKTAKGQYILFIDPDDYLSLENVLEVIYYKSVKENIDILEFKTFHWMECRESSKILQIELFDKMYFDSDNFYQLKQYHLTGKLILKELLVNTLESIDNFYVSQNMNFYEESMLLFILFKKAQSFELLKIQGTVKNCNHCDLNVNLNEEDVAKDFLLYFKFLMQYSDNKVPEKRFLVSLFINNIIDKNIKVKSEETIKLMKEINNSFAICEKINEVDKNRIITYNYKE